MKLTPDWLNEKQLQAAMAALIDEGYEVFLVGGCVRDAVRGVPCNDIDLSTNATPGEVYRIMKAAGFRMVPIGPEHGTWGVRRGGKTYEITTYRYDVSTDGRRATVEFADTMEEDASRRDFTMNALYMDREGNVFDPTGQGVADAKAGRVKFVGDADLRCQEDLLRVMRLFRFHAKYKGEDWVIDKEEFDAARRYAPIITQQVSGERIWDETKKILSAVDPFTTVQQMSEAGVDEHVYGVKLGLDQMRGFVSLLEAEKALNASPQWHRRYLVLFGKTIRFPASKQDYRKVEILDTAWGEHDKSVAVLAQKYGKHVPFDQHLMLGRTRPFDSDECRRGVAAKLPVTADDLMAELGLSPGPDVGAAMRRAKQLWFDSNLHMSKAELLEET